MAPLRLWLAIVHCLLLSARLCQAQSDDIYSFGQWYPPDSVGCLNTAANNHNCATSAQDGNYNTCLCGGPFVREAIACIATHDGAQLTNAFETMKRNCADSHTPLGSDYDEEAEWKSIASSANAAASAAASATSSAKTTATLGSTTTTAASATESRATSSGPGGSSTRSLAATSTSTAPSISTRRPTESASTSSSAPGPSDTSGSGGGMSTGAKVGIGVGVGVGALGVLAFLAAWFLVRRRRTPPARGADSHSTSLPSDMISQGPRGPAPKASYFADERPRQLHPAELDGHFPAELGGDEPGVAR